jgi:hypothetical protein
VDGRGSHGPGLKKGTISQIPSSAAVSRDGCGSEPMITGVGVLKLCRRMRVVIHPDQGSMILDRLAERTTANVLQS